MTHAERVGLALMGAMAADHATADWFDRHYGYLIAPDTFAACADRLAAAVDVALATEG